MQNKISRLIFDLSNQLKQYIMNYTKKFQQVSKAAAKSKFARMQTGAGRFGQSSFECGFSTWWIGNDSENGSLAIYVSSNYHSETTIDNMYKTNCKTW